MLKVEVERQLDNWIGQGDNLEKWISNWLTASDLRVHITQWMGAAMETMDKHPGYRFRLFEKCGMAMTVEGTGDERITLEGMDKPYTFVDAEDPCNEGVSKTWSGWCVGGGHEDLGGVETGVGGGCQDQGDDRGGEMESGESSDNKDDGESSDDEDDGNFDFPSL